MAHKRQDTLVAPKEWARHLRPFEKRKQAKAERRAIRKQIGDETDYINMLNNSIFG